jgi:hypothetical protein
MNRQFAYNEISLMLIRLLQAFSEITLDPEANPASKPPASWAAGKGRIAQEKIWIRSHLTMYANVSLQSSSVLVSHALCVARMGVG